MGEYPEHDKMAKVREQSQACGEFLEWLGEQGYQVGEFVLFDGYSEEQFVPIYRPMDELLAGFFGIDLKLIEQEKQAMLRSFQEANDRG